MGAFNSRAVFECTALKGTNKQGNLKPDADGYYTLVLGALDYYNSKGQFYTYSAGKKLFEDSSPFMRRIAQGSLYGECGHPRQDNLSNRDYMNRIMDVRETNVAAHFRRIYLDDKAVRGPDGRMAIAIIGEVRPAGPMGPALKDALENSSQNVCFSIRSLTQDEMVRGVVHKNLRTIMTFDWVCEPGISVARKWSSPALESLSEMYTTVDDIELLRNETVGTIGMESESTKLLTEALESIKTADQNLPASARW